MSQAVHPPTPDNSRDSDGSAETLRNIRIVLARPMYSGNIGSVCRAMANMGLSDLALVSRVAPDLDEARKMACAAVAILDQRRETSSLAAAVADCALVIGTTARAGLYREHAKTPREWAQDILAAARTNKVALVFGTEDNGLSNEELTACSRLIQIPSSPAYPSLNLSHAVTICAYELYMAGGTHAPIQERAPLATAEMKARLFALWEQALLEIGFMEPEKARHMMLGIRRIFARGILTEADVRILMGMARQTRWAAHHHSSQGDAPPPDRNDQA